MCSAAIAGTGLIITYPTAAIAHSRADLKLVNHESSANRTSSIEDMSVPQENLFAEDRSTSVVPQSLSIASLSSSLRPQVNNELDHTPLNLSSPGHLPTLSVSVLANTAPEAPPHSSSFNDQGLWEQSTTQQQRSQQQGSMQQPIDDGGPYSQYWKLAQQRLPNPAPEISFNPSTTIAIASAEVTPDSSYAGHISDSGYLSDAPDSVASDEESATLYPTAFSLLAPPLDVSTPSTVASRQSTDRLSLSLPSGWISATQDQKILKERWGLLLAQAAENAPEESISAQADAGPSLPAGTDSTLANVDPELGILRLRPLSGGSAAVIDPELGVLRLRAITPPPERRPTVFLQGSLGVFSGDNLLARTDPLPDTTLNAGLLLRAVPRVGRRTFLIGTAGGSVLRYADNGEFDYNNLEFRLGVYHWLTRRAYVDLHWRNQQFFTRSGGDRFLDNHQARLTLGRVDPLTPHLTLNSSYQLQSSWSDPEERSRLTNRFNLGLSQQLNDQLEAGLSYQLALIDFTQQDRYDSYHQVLAQFRYQMSDTTSLSVFGGGRLGDSSNSFLDFNSTLFGLSLIVNLPLF